MRRRVLVDAHRGLAARLKIHERRLALRFALRTLTARNRGHEHNQLAPPHSLSPPCRRRTALSLELRILSIERRRATNHLHNDSTRLLRKTVGNGARLLVDRTAELHLH